MYFDGVEMSILFVLLRDITISKNHIKSFKWPFNKFWANRYCLQIIWNLSIHIKWFSGIECMIWKCRSYLFLEHCWFYTPLGIGLLGNRCKTIKQTLFIIWNNNTVLTMILHLDYTVGIITKTKNLASWNVIKPIF